MYKFHKNFITIGFQRQLGLGFQTKALRKKLNDNKKQTMRENKQNK